MVEQRANLDYGADDTDTADDAVVDNTGILDPAGYANVRDGGMVDEEVVDPEEDDKMNPEASTYGAP